MKLIKIIFPFFLIILIIIISFNAYKEAESVTNNPLSVIPYHSSVILKINKPDKIFSIFNNKIICNKLSSIGKIEEYNKDLKKINNFYNSYKIDPTNSLFISFLKDGTSSNGFLLSSELDLESIKKIKNKFLDNNYKIFNYDNIEIYNIANDSINIFLTNINNIICISSSKTIIEDAIKSSNSEYNFVNNDRFINIYNTINKSSDINVIYNLNNLLKATKTDLIDDIKLLNNLSDWVASDLKINDDKIILNGFNLIDDKLSVYAVSPSLDELIVDALSSFILNVLFVENGGSI